MIIKVTKVLLLIIILMSIFIATIGYVSCREKIEINHNEKLKEAKTLKTYNNNNSHELSDEEFWGQFEQIEQAKPSKLSDEEFWSQFEQIEQKPTTGQRIASGAKDLVAGIGGGAVDALTLIYNLPATMLNITGIPQMMSSIQDVANNKAPTASPMPTISSLTEGINSGIDTLTGGYTKTPQDQKHLNEGLKFAGSVASGGIVGKVAGKLGKKGIEESTKYIGSLKPRYLTAGGVAGYITSDATEATGDNLTGSLYGLGAGIGANLLLSPSASWGSAMRNLGKKKLDADTLKAGRDIGLNLQAEDTTDLTGSFFANLFSNAKKPNLSTTAIDRMSKKATNVLDKAYNSVLPEEQLATVKQQIDLEYLREQELRPKSITLESKELLSEADQVIVIRAKESVIKKAKEIKKIFSIPASIDELVAQQRHWYEATYNWRVNNEIRDQFKKYTNAIERDLSSFVANSNDINVQKWYQQYKIADALYTKKAHREKLESLFSKSNTGGVNSKIAEPTGTVKYKSLAEILQNRKNKETLAKIVTPEIMQDLEKLEKSTVALLAQKEFQNTRDKNLMDKVAQNIKNAPYVGTVVGLIFNGLEGIGRLVVSNEKLLKQAIKVAENQDKSSFIKFNQMLKDYAGFTAPQAFGLNISHENDLDISKVRLQDDPKKLRHMFSIFPRGDNIYFKD